MSEHIVKTIEDLVGRVAAAEADVVRMKRTINDLCDLAKIPHRYAGSELEAGLVLGPVRSDQYYGRPLATVIKEYLQMRRAGNKGPASVNEIYEALIAGGYTFGTPSEENAKRVLRDNLQKNPAFHRLPNSGDYGLREWYPVAKESRGKGRSDGSKHAQAQDDGDGGDTSPTSLLLGPGDPDAREGDSQGTFPDS